MPELGTSHQRAVGGRLASLLDLVNEARAAGMEGETLDELEATTRRLLVEIGAPPRPTASGKLLAILTQAHVLAYELEPRRLRAYGELSQADAAYLSDVAANLRTLTSRLLDTHECRGKTS